MVPFWLQAEKVSANGLVKGGLGRVEEGGMRQRRRRSYLHTFQYETKFRNIRLTIWYKRDNSNFETASTLFLNEHADDSPLRCSK